MFFFPHTKRKYLINFTILLTKDPKVEPETAISVGFIKLRCVENCGVSNGREGFPVVRHTLLEKMDLRNDREPLSPTLAARGERTV